MEVSPGWSRRRRRRGSSSPSPPPSSACLFLAATRRARSAWQSRSEKKRTLCCRARHVKVQIGTIFVDAPRTQKQDTKGLYAHLGSAQPKNAPAGCGCSSPCLIARESLRVGSFAHVARVRAAVLAHGWLQPRYFWAVLLWRRSPKAPYAAFLSGAGQAVAVRSLALRLRRARRGRRALSQLLQRLAKKLALHKYPPQQNQPRPGAPQANGCKVAAARRAC